MYKFVKDGDPKQIIGDTIENNFMELLKFKWDELHNQSDAFRYKIDNLQERLVHGYLLQLNPDRGSNRRQPEIINNVCQPFDKDKFNFTKVSNREILFYLFREGNVSDIHSLIVNVSPISRYHTLLCPSMSKCLPQVVTQDSLEVALDIIFFAKNRDLRIGFNSLCALASVNHLHYHLFLESNILPVETAKCKHIQGPLFCFEDYPAPGFCFQITSQESVKNMSEEIYNLLRYLLENSIAHNLFITRGKSLVLGDDKNESLVPEDNKNESLVPGDNENESLVTGDDKNKRFVPGDNENKSLVPEDNENERLVPGDDKNESLVPGDNENESLVTGDDKNKSLVPEDNENQSLVPEDNENKSLVPEDNENKSLVPGDNENESLVPEDNENKSLVPGDNENESLVPEDNENKSLVPGDNENESLVPGHNENKSLVPGDNENEVVRVIVWPRRSSSGAKQLDAFNVAVCELSGWFPVYDKTAYENLKTEELEHELKKWRLENFDVLCDNVKTMF